MQKRIDLMNIDQYTESTGGKFYTCRLGFMNPLTITTPNFPGRRMHKILMIDTNFESAVQFSKKVPWTQLGYFFFIEYTDVAGMGKLKQIDPDVLIIKNNVVYVDIDTYIRAAIHQNWNIKIIVLAEPEADFALRDDAHVIAVFGQEASPDVVLPVIQAAVLQDESQEAKNSRVNESGEIPADDQDVFRRLLGRNESRVIYILRVLPLQKERKALPHFQKKLSGPLEDLNHGWFQERDGTLCTVIGDDENTSILFSMRMLWQLTQDILSGIKNTKAYGDTELFALISARVSKEDALEEYKAVKQLEPYIYFCSGAGVLNAEYLKTQRKEVDPKAVGTLGDRLLLSTLDGDTVGIVRCLEEIYLDNLKKSMDLGLVKTCREVIRKQYFSAAAVLHVLGQAEPLDFEQGFTFLEEELRYMVRQFEKLRELGRGKAHVRKQTVNTLGIIQNHYMEDISLSTISEELDITSTYLSKIFKEDMGMGLVDFINLTRVSKAKEFLQGGTQSILEISRAVGFQDSKYFSRVFKKAEGKTPTEYAQETREKEYENS